MLKAKALSMTINEEIFWLHSWAVFSTTNLRTGLKVYCHPLDAEAMAKVRVEKVRKS